MYSLHEAFESQVVRAPHSLAVTWNGDSLTYAELDALANSVARRLEAHGVGRNQLVGLCAERGIQMIVGMLGILKAGAAYVAFDPTFPAERLTFLAHDSGVSHVVTTEAQKSVVPRGPTLVVVDDSRADRSENGRTKAATHGSDAAYMIYTSGSTGVPKGVIVEHRQALRLFSSTKHWFSFDSTDTWTLFHSIGFDFSVWEIWGAFLYGGRLVIVPSETTIAPERFHELLVREQVTMLSQTPSAFQQLCRAQEISGKKVPPTLRTVVLGGEAFDPQALRGFFAQNGEAAPEIVNMFGITETTVHVTYRRILPQDAERAGRSPIGVPIPDLSVYLLDSSGRAEVPIGEIGEIYVAGAGVARGYHNRPELDAQRFLADPFGKDPNGRMYRSGDLAIRLANGELEYVGRADAQVKVRGYRIEPGEVESCLRRCPRVSEAIVVSRDYGEGDKRLVAYVVPGNRRDGRRVIDDLRTLAAVHLPEHMRPSAYCILDALPLNSNGKVDRSALPPPDEAPSSSEGLERLPASDLEIRLAEVWRRVLGVSKLSLDADFFDAGGTSLSAIRVLAAIEEQMGISLDMSIWAEHATVAAFAQILVEMRQTPSPFVSRAH